jgi:signal transduction histidine kinase/predicted RNA-binding protein with RPS1 domain/DNA-binding NarL/FixJ family response regulator
VDTDTVIITELNRRYPKGTHLTARVRTLTSFGAIVKLPDGSAGIIRNRELSWSQELPAPSAMLSEGQTVEVLVLGVDRVQPHPRLELSLRQAERDPWADLYKRYHVGQVLRRKVVSLTRTGAFVELEPAVTGFVPLQEVSQAPPERIEDVLWVGDTVQATITHIDPAARQLRLSLRRHLIELERKPSGFPLGELLNQEQRQLLLNWFKERRAGDSNESVEIDGWAELAAKFPRILLVDDDPSIRHSLQRLLKRLGHQVETCDGAERAITLCSEQDFDLVLLDHELGMDKLKGTEAAQRLTRAHPKLPVVIVTGINWLAQHYDVKAEARAAGARGALIKPVEFGRLHHMFTELAAGRDNWDETPMSNLPVVEPGPPGEMTLAREDLLRTLGQKLNELQKITKAESCVLFHMNLSTRQVSVFAHVGAQLTNYDGSKYTLQATPIEQVIHEGQTLYEPDTTRNPQKFQHLDIVNFASCIGLPVKGFGQREYGLFLFHPRKGHFTTECLRKAEIAAELIAALMARKEAGRVIQQMQPFVFAGQLGSHLVHELNNRLSSILNDAQTLAFDYSALEQRSLAITAPLSSEVQHRLSEMQTCIRNLQENGRAMHKIMRLYLGMVSPENREAVNLNEVIHRAVSILTPIAEGYGVRVVTDADNNLPSTYAVGVRVEQVLVNVAINAIQHTHLAKGGGEMLIQSRFASQDSRLPLQLRVADTGPGIHHQHLEYIYDLGFSTRREGNGLGLFITRGLVESMSGRISVEETVMTVGTTFLIELPLVLPCIEGA